MLTATQTALTSEQKHFLLRRIHSLLGIVPLGGFLFFHLFENSKALQGKAAYDDMVHTISGLPYLMFIEWAFIFIPILFHGFYGVIIATDAKRTLGHARYNPAGTLRFYIQRATGVFLIAFILYHVFSTRIWVGYLGHEGPGFSMYDFMTEHFHKDWWVIPLYAAGITCAAYHLANGIWSFAIVWGITIRKKAQDLVLILVSAPVFMVLVGMGIWALMHFPKPEPKMAVVSAQTQTLSEHR